MDRLDRHPLPTDILGIPMACTVLHKLVLVLCLVVQLWGGSGADRLCVCTRAATSQATSCQCCSRHERAPAERLGVLHSEGCCLRAAMPDDARVLPSRDHIGSGEPAGFVEAMACLPPLAISREVRSAWPLTHGPPVWGGLASTILRV